jgi:hypothetical protein
VYSPTATNTPIFTKKGDSKIAVNYSSNLTANWLHKNNNINKAVGFDVQTAYAIAPHWAIQLNFFNRKEKNIEPVITTNTNITTIDYKRNLTEVGIGYFKRSKKNKQVTLQIFIALAKGSFNFTDEIVFPNNTSSNKYHDVKITKFFVQPALSIQFKKNIFATLSSKISFLFFNTINTNYTSSELIKYSLNNLTNSPRVFWEPAVIQTFGFKKAPAIKLECQVDFSFLLSKQFVDARFFNFSVGVLFDFAKILQHKKTSSKKLTTVIL